MNKEEIKVISFSIDLTKIPEEKIVKTDSKGESFKNGGQFINLTMFINNEEDKYGNDVSVTLSKPKDSQEQTIYVGNGKVFKK